MNARAGWNAVCLLLISAVLAPPASGADLLDEARQRMDRGELRAAEIQLKNLLQQEPDNVSALLLLTEAYLTLELPELARTQLQRARSLGAAPADSELLLARLYIEERAFSRLLEDIHPVDSFPAPVQAALVALRGQAHLALGHDEEASEAFERALALDAASVDAHLGAARVFLEDRDLEQARLHLDAARIRDADNVDALLIEGELARIEGQPERAAEAFARALERRPGSTLARLGSAAVLLKQDQLRAAERQLAPVLEHTPNHPLANYLRAELAWRQGRADEARSAVQLALGFLPNHLPSHLLLGGILYAEGDAEEAVRHLEPYVREVPGHLGARKLLAAAQLRVGRASDALRTLAPVLESEPDDIRALSLAAAASMRAGHFERAGELYSRVVELDPDAVEVRGRLVASLLASGLDLAASQHLEQAAELGLDPVETGILRTQIALRQSDPEAALGTARALQRSAPENPMGHHLAGIAYLALDDLNSARSEFQAALAMRPEFTLAAMNLAALELRAGATGVAQKQYQDILQHRPDYVPALMGLARIAVAAEDNAEVVKWLERARAADATARAPREWLYRYHLSGGRTEQALELAREIAAAHPDRPESLRMLGTAQQAVKLIKRARDSFARLVEVQPQQAENHYLYATALADYGDADGARKSLQRALARDPDFLKARIALGALEARAQRPDAALAVAREIQERHPDEAAGFELEGDVHMAQRASSAAADAYARAYERATAAHLARKLFEAYRKGGREERAHALLEQWLEANPADTQMRSLLAQAYQLSGASDRAIKHYRRLLEDDPTRADVLNNLAWIVLETQPDQAHAWAEQAYALAPEDPAVLDTYGLVLLHQGRYGEAVRTLQEALLKAPQSSEIRYHLAMALERTGDWEHARRHVKQVLYTDPQFPESRAAEALLERLRERP